MQNTHPDNAGPSADSNRTSDLPIGTSDQAPNASRSDPRLDQSRLQADCTGGFDQ